MALLEIRNLAVRFPTSRGMLNAVEGVDLRVEPGEVLGIVGDPRATGWHARGR